MEKEKGIPPGISLAGALLGAGLIIGSCASTGYSGMRKCRANCCSLNRQCVENGTGMSPNVGFGGPEARLEREWHKTA